MDLAEFLLARIAEDEAGARRVQAAYDDEENFWAPSVVINAGALVIPRRVLAECEAKRRIVGELSDERVYNMDYDQGRRDALDDVLHLLALPYADHPDYREEWRP